MLMASVPGLARKWEEVEIALKGESSKLPTGCAYYSRCPLAANDGDCALQAPGLVAAGTDHFVA